MQRTSLSRLIQAERKELEEILRSQPNERFLSDYGDSSAWWLLALLGGLGGGIAAALEMEGMLRPVTIWGPLAVAAWAAYTWITNHRRRGYVATSFAIVRIKGRRVVMMSHAELARVEWEKIATYTQRFSVLTLTGSDGRKMTCYVHAGWVRTAIAMIDQARKSAGLPPIEGDARKLPE